MPTIRVITVVMSQLVTSRCYWAFVRPTGRKETAFIAVVSSVSFFVGILRFTFTVERSHVEIAKGTDSINIRYWFI